MQDPKNLLVWQRSMELAVVIHGISKQIPARTLPGVATQLIRAIASVPANIAEGVGQPYPAVTVRHLMVAIGSAYECETHLLIADRLAGPVQGLETTLDELEQVRRMLYGLKRHYDERVPEKRVAGPAVNSRRI
ncbi:four helix bundle protein [Gemmatimonas sp.]|uniref:four helix bundle protein n=1 Tax=Gemmatimonas sp. TaxID=1962908 RepID=UPI00333EC479